MEVSTIEAPRETDASFFKGLEGLTVAAEAERTFDSLKALGLIEHALELHIKGLTVIPPEKVASAQTALRLREAVLDVAERRGGVRPDVENSAEIPGTPFGRNVSYLLFEDEVFQSFLLDPALVAMCEYMLGRNYCLSSYQSLIKGAGGKDLSLHTDELLVAPPYSPINDGINATYMLTDYTIEGGALAYVPGSHKYLRQPVGNEGLSQMVPVTGPAGSLVLWNGATWHGAYGRKIAGLRMNLVIYFVRPHMLHQEPYRESITPAQLSAIPDRLRKILGIDLGMRWKEEGPTNDGSQTLIGANAFC